MQSSIAVRMQFVIGRVAIERGNDEDGPRRPEQVDGGHHQRLVHLKTGHLRVRAKPELRERDDHIFVERIENQLGGAAVSANMHTRISTETKH